MLMKIIEKVCDKYNWTNKDINHVFYWELNILIL